MHHKKCSFVHVQNTRRTLLVVKLQCNVNTKIMTVSRQCAAFRTSASMLQPSRPAQPSHGYTGRANTLHWTDVSVVCLIVYMMYTDCGWAACLRPCLRPGRLLLGRPRAVLETSRPARPASQQHLLAGPVLCAGLIYRPYYIC